jgi:phosphohistidine phosphatase
MILYILRHAIAADKAEWKGADSDRPLTKDGIRKMKKVAKGMRRLDIKVEWILTSPYRRAYETAVIAARELKLKKRLKTSRMLTPDGDIKALIKHLGLNFRTWESVMLVGHEPYLGSLIGLLAAGNASAGTLLDKAGLAKLSTDSLTYGQCARLEWLLSPRILKKLS